MKEGQYSVEPRKAPEKVPFARKLRISFKSSSLRNEASHISVLRILGTRGNSLEKPILLSSISGEWDGLKILNTSWKPGKRGGVGRHGAQRMILLRVTDTRYENPMGHRAGLNPSSVVGTGSHSFRMPPQAARRPRTSIKSLLFIHSERLCLNTGSNKAGSAGTVFSLEQWSDTGRKHHLLGEPETPAALRSARW